MREALGLDPEVKEIANEDTGEIIQTEQEPGAETDSEVAIRKSAWDKFASANPALAQELDEFKREGTRGVTAREEYANKYADLLAQATDRLNAPTAEAEQARNIVAQVQQGWANVRDEVGFKISNEQIETESLIYGHYLLNRYKEYGFSSPEEFHKIQIQNGTDPVSTALNQLMFHRDWEASEFKAWGVHMSENADSETEGAGSVQKLEGPETDELIDYHLKMDEQPEDIQDKAQTLIEDLRAAGFKTEPLLDGDIPGKTFYTRLKAITKLKAYRDFAHTDNKHADQLASELLGKYGIPGMSYWHEKPTAKKAGVRKFIIWDKAIIDAQTRVQEQEQETREPEVTRGPEPETITPEVTQEPEVIEAESVQEVQEPEAGLEIEILNNDDDVINLDIQDLIGQSTTALVPANNAGQIRKLI